MKIFVLGGGVIGVTTAYYLAEAGHEVTVFDRQKGPALETSFANAGEISPGYASPWAGPGIPLKAIKWLLMKHGPLVVRPAFDPYMWTWLIKMLRNCTADRYAINKARMVPLAEYSRDTLKALREATGIAYDERTKGTLQLFRTQKQLDGTGGDVEVLKKYGVPYELLDPEGCIGAEPALAGVREKFVGGLRLPGDETGDCKMFTDRLAELCVARGVTFEYGTQIRRFSKNRNRIVSVGTDQRSRAADAYVLALGSYSARFMRLLRRPIPVYPVKGYSITVPIKDAVAAPVSTVMDETYKVAITRLGDRIRVGGTAEISGFDLRLHESRRRTLEHSVGDLFPDGGDLKAASFWCGLRPMTPDGPPLVGRTEFSNLYLNTGHGTLGWTMACGSAKVLSDIISSKVPDIDVRELGPERYLR
ncbi:D-amino acid dehydrogenase [Mesorhizobium sp. M1148]|uniref:D-amino acid dehydrogenase n=1 Tax=unclassified Mesorhizobium TaxID=325217 RepID=UPI0003CF0A08|nr:MULTISPECIES: D-amino acid dehydrogenase [unclassified Mesorhizobium]ESW65905.1 D-amino acid dehydrogenase small subunit [Mesorhizobium sp. LSJC277A00]ESW86589.1 D-amino acid dehydrogenase small subunit [Mesorhizobium sp. LSJC285A00]ESX07461.1 D-amino acid dehydrogenase small subunit [Mesorhizobium sp. LSJC265A00]ESX18542.1 D-amino acid dehydrogenase small subunit [Mesorhizobium sp. LSJC255A00]ESX27940.1 D-amino acid dehydrogenase small subunit [Mesorhizobium sp. LSHC440B00]